MHRNATEQGPSGTAEPAGTAARDENAALRASDEPSTASTVESAADASSAAESVDDELDQAPDPGGAAGGGSRRSRRALTAMTIVMALAIAYVAGVLTVRLSVPGEDSPEAGFARDMSTHHAQAVAMAMIEYQRGTLPGLRVIAYDIATVQQAQKGMMGAWLDGWGDSQTSDKPPMAWMPNGAAELGPDGLMPGMATAAEMAELQNATGDNVDRIFLNLMIKHHLGGIHMTEAILKSTHNDQVRTLATSIKATQGPEVTQMKQILEQLTARTAK